MASSLCTDYKQLFRSLNHLLPHAIEHLVATNILTRTEARRVMSTSDQFNRLCELLASKGHEKKAVIFSEIESFCRSREQHKQTADGRCDETPVQHNYRHV